MTQTLDRAAVDAQPSQREIPGPLWRVAGGLVILHVVLMLAGVSQEKSVVLTDGPDTVQKTYGSGSLDRVFAGGYLELLAFLVLLPAIVFLARALGRRTETGRWAAQTGLAAGITCIASTVAVGLPAGAAAVYGAHHHLADGGTLALVNDVRNFAFYLSMAVLGVHAIATGVSALADGVMRRWVGFGGVAVGAVMVLGMAAQKWIDTVNLSSLLWMIWWVGLGISLLRRPSTR
ncbi:MAG: hypothetical protein QOI82_2602 [Actinomycetota bacterium]|jgi:hypothetical protein|nr:hypothetical protein [Actinomycetota bacterium]